MIDYVIVQMRVRERVVRMEVEDSVKSDHHPLVVSLGGKRKRVGKGE